MKRMIAAVLMGTWALVSVPVEGRGFQWIYTEQDIVNAYQQPYALAVSGTVKWWRANDNPNHRYVYVDLKAYQTRGANRPMCIGVRVTYTTTKVSSSDRGGAGGGGVSITGPSVNVQQTWNQTTSNGVTSDGFDWVCPRPVGGGGMAYVQKVVQGGRPVHPAVDGVVTGAAIDTCVADRGRLANRYCLQTEYNRYGGR
jgi:hypothetical protein